MFALMRGEIILNGFKVAPALAELMLRPDWPGKRRTTPNWLERFPTHPESRGGQIPFVQFCSVEGAVIENEACRDPELAMLLGKPSAEFPPGDFDPTAGYLIGFTDYCDSSICVDLRPSRGPRIIYECFGPHHPLFATAFASVDDFVAFYLSQQRE